MVLDKIWNQLKIWLKIRDLELAKSQEPIAKA